jgi:hypothetical protein
MNNADYQKKELTDFINQTNRYFDTVANFIEQWEDSTAEELLTQLEWVENGIYGAGACFALQAVLKNLNKRTNNNARIGQVFLKCLYGAKFRYWAKLPVTMQENLNKAVETWLAQEKNFAQELAAD